MFGNNSAFRRYAKAFSISLLNQGLSSATNFALGFYLVRVLSPTDFGLYGISFAIALFLTGVGNALFITQMVVNYPYRPLQDIPLFAVHVWAGLSTFLVLCALSGLLLLEVARISWEAPAEYQAIGFVTIALSIALASREFFVRLGYSEKREHKALEIHLVIALSIAVGLAIIWVTGHKITGVQALWVLGTANFAGVFVGMVRSGLPYRQLCYARVISETLGAWQNGRWALGGVTVTWLQSQAYMAVTAVFLGPAGVGLANAAKLIIAPASFIQPAVNQVVMPRLVALNKTSPSLMMKIRAKFTFGLTGFAVLYSLVVLLTADSVAPLLIGAQYTDIFPMIAAWCIVLVLQFARGGVSTLMQIMRLFRQLTLNNAISAITALAAAYFLIRAWGEQGAILGTAIGELVLLISLVNVLRGERVRSNATG